MQKWVTEQKTIQVPHTVRKWVAYSYDRLVPRTVVTRVPIGGWTTTAYPPATSVITAPPTTTYRVDPPTPVTSGTTTRKVETAEPSTPATQADEPAADAADLDPEITPEEASAAQPSATTSDDLGIPTEGASAIEPSGTTSGSNILGLE